MGKPHRRANPKVVTKVDRNLAELTAKEAKKFARRLPLPWEPHKCGRRPTYDSRTVFVLCLLMVSLNLTYDAMTAEMRKGYLEEILKVKRLPSRSTLHRDMLRLNQKYIRKFNKLLIRRFVTKGIVVVVDSTGISLRISSSWYNIRIGRESTRKDNTKLHIAVGIRRNVVVGYRLTPYYKHDSQYLPFLLKDLDQLLRVLADAAYLTTQNCNAVAKKNGKPFFAIKVNTLLRNDESVAWEDMVWAAKERKKLYEAIYHMRSLVECIFSAIKRRYGNGVRAVRRKGRNIMIALRVLAFNIKQRLYDQMARRLKLPFWVRCN